MRPLFSVLMAFAAFIALLQLEPPGFISDSNSWFLEYPVAGVAPGVRLSADNSGQDILLKIIAENFVFSEDCAVAGQVPRGHAHVYIDGIKQTTTYHPHTVIKNLAAGRHEITVSLNVLPDHKFLTYEGKPVQASVTVNVTG